MKNVMKIVKNLCIGIFTIYSVNVLFSTVNVVIPINLFTICMSSFLGISGIVAIIVIRFMI